MSRTLLSALLLCLSATPLLADAPVAAYIFPAGGQQKVNVRVGGLCLYEKCPWELLGPGVTSSKFLTRTKTVWFEGPRLPLPDSQRQENYPQDMLGDVTIAKDASPGIRRGRLWTSEGAHAGLAFMVGDLPEVVETEVDGDPIPVAVKLPVTVNGRIFPREDIDVWTFTARKGQLISCEVHAARLGSPLDSRLEVRGPDGKLITENDDARGTDSLLSFTAAQDGTHSVRIHDSQRGGSQRHVYRLTLRDGPFVSHIYPLGGRKGTKVKFTLSGANVPASVEQILGKDVGVRMQSFNIDGKTTNGVPLDIDDLPEHLQTKEMSKVTLPCVVNGRIDRPGAVGSWKMAVTKGRAVQLELRNGQLSPLVGVIEVQDEAGKSLARSNGSPSLLFNPPRDGDVVVQIRDQFRTRGGPVFAYRLCITEARPDFSLELSTAANSVVRGGKANLRLKVNRTGGFNTPIALTITGLPKGVKVTPTTINANQPQVDLAFSVDMDAPVGVARIRIKGTATVNGKAVERVASLELRPDDIPVDDVLLAVALKAPFKLVGAYDLRIAPRGSVFRKKYKIERDGYTGPLVVRLGDIQARHLQGVTGPTLTIAADVNEFEYPITLPPWMETGRTSRACVMAIGKVKVDGVEHVVSYTSQAQNDQMIAVVETGQLGLELGRSSLAVKPGESVELPVSIRRGKGLKGAVKVELIVPEHIHGVSAEVLALAADKLDGKLKVKFGSKCGPFSQRLIVRATLTTPAGPVTAEAELELAGD